MKNIRVKTILCCDFVIIDNREKLSLIGIFQKIILKKIPGGVPRFFLVSLLETDNQDKEKEYLFKLKITDSHDKEIGTNLPVLTIKTPRGETNGQIIIEIVNLNFQEGGKYKFEVYANDIPIGSTLIEVDVAH